MESFNTQTQSTAHSHQYLREAEASSVVGLAPSTLAKMRAKGCGPPFVKIGRAVRYPRRLLIEWLDSRTTSVQYPRQELAKADESGRPVRDHAQS